MEFILGLPTDEVHNLDEFCTGEAVAEISRAAESMGFTGVFVTDHPMPPDSFLENGGHHALEPTVALSFAAAATTTLRLMTNLLIVGYRNPFLAAKAIASLDQLSGGRVIMGTGAGYLEAEFDALGAEFENRNDVLDDTLVQMKATWSGESVVASGPSYSVAGNHALPRPATRPHPPIWIGGNSKRALRRAVTLGSGWIPMPAPKGMASFVRTAAVETMEDLAERLQYANEHAEKVGQTEPLDVATGPWDAGRFGTEKFDRPKYLDRVGELAELGVHYAPVNFTFPGSGGLTSRAQFLDTAGRFADEVIRAS